MALPRPHRLPGGAVRALLVSGERRAEGPLLVRRRPRAAGPARVAIRVAGARTAVERNLVRRRLAEALRPSLPSLPPVDVVLTWRLRPDAAPPSADETRRRWAAVEAGLRPPPPTPSPGRRSASGNA